MTGNSPSTVVGYFVLGLLALFVFVTLVRSVRIGEPRDGVVEACALVSDGGRLRAVAVRMEGLDGRWRVTALEIG